MIRMNRNNPKSPIKLMRKSKPTKALSISKTSKTISLNRNPNKVTKR